MFPSIRVRFPLIHCRNRGSRIVSGSRFDRFRWWCCSLLLFLLVVLAGLFQHVFDVELGVVVAVHTSGEFLGCVTDQSLSSRRTSFVFIIFDLFFLQYSVSWFCNPSPSWLRR